jgi:hypothetical protein
MMDSIIAALNEQRNKLQGQIDRIDSAIKALNGQEISGVNAAVGSAKTGGGHISAAGRRRLSQLMKKRWAERRAKAGKKGK